MTYRTCVEHLGVWIVWAMKPDIRPNPPNDWVRHQLQGGSGAVRIMNERRDRLDRRRRIFWAVLYGGFFPRRRSLPRRLDDSRFHSLDWHAAHLLAVAIGIVLLSVADAFLTVILLSSGAHEVNPIMAPLVYGNIALFAALKIGMTAGVIFMVVLARYRFMRFVRVQVMMYSILIAYFGLIGYELWMFNSRIDPLLL